MDSHYDDIYALFEKNKPHEKQAWKLKDFAVAGKGPNGKLINKYFNPLPPKANYFENGIASVLYDKSTGQLSCDWDHIIIERCERFPAAFFTENCPEGFTDIDGHSIEEVTKMPDKKQVEYFKKLKDKIEADTQTKNKLINRAEAALQLAKKRAEWNYKTAVPMYYPRDNKNNLLLPLAVVKEDVIDLALVVERLENGNYQGHTILTLSMAYNNSRLITRPDSDWLSPGQIKKTDTDEDDNCD